MSREPRAEPRAPSAKRQAPSAESREPRAASEKTGGRVAFTPERYVPAGILLFLIVLPYLLPNPFYVHIIVMMAIYVVLGGAWNILSGYAGQLSLGHSVFLLSVVYV